MHGLLQSPWVARWAVLGAYHYAAHGLVTTRELELFLEAVRAQVADLGGA